MANGTLSSRRHRNGFFPPFSAFVETFGGDQAVPVLTLREVGFRNVYAMKGGLAVLMEYLTPKTAL